METTELIKIAQDTFVACSDTLIKKNHDYSKGEDALRNFKLVEVMKLTDIATGIAVRLCDKFSRICNLLNTEAKVKDEAIEDTIDDMINYLVLLKASLKEQRKK
jgi:hypothetical protein